MLFQIENNAEIDISGIIFNLASLHKFKLVLEFIWFIYRQGVNKVYTPMAVLSALSVVLKSELISMNKKLKELLLSTIVYHWRVRQLAPFEFCLNYQRHKVGISGG